MKKLIYVLLVVALIALPSAVSAQFKSHHVVADRWWTVADGLAGDSTNETTKLQAMLDSAKATTGYLRLDSGVYYLTDSVVVPEGVTLDGNGSKLHFELSGASKRALVVRSNTTVRNLEIDLDSITTLTSDGAYGACIIVGEYPEPDPATKLENVTLDGLSLNTEKIHGVCITILGYVENVRITNCVFTRADTNSAGDGAWVAAGAEWAYQDGHGAGDLDSITYHPKNIYMENLTVEPYEDISSKSFYFSAVEGIIGKNIYIDTCGLAVANVAGEFGYMYAEDSVHQQGDTVSVNAEWANVQIAYTVDEAFYVKGKPGTKTDSRVFHRMTFNNCIARGQGATVKAGYNLQHTAGIVINNCEVTGYGRGVLVHEGADNVSVLNSKFHGNQAEGLHASSASDPPDNLYVSNCEFYANGGDTLPGVGVGTVARMTVDNCLFGDSAVAERQLYGVDVGSSVGLVVLSDNHVVTSYNDVGYNVTDSTVCINNTVSAGLTDYAGAARVKIFDTPADVPGEICGSMAVVGDLWVVGTDGAGAVPALRIGDTLVAENSTIGFFTSASNVTPQASIRYTATGDYFAILNADLRIYTGDLYMGDGADGYWDIIWDIATSESDGVLRYEYAGDANIFVFNKSLRVDGDSLCAEGNIYINKDSTAADATIYFGDDDEVTSIHWDDANDQFEVSDDLSVSGTISSADTLDYIFVLADPDALYTEDHEWPFDPRTKAALTVVRIDVTLDADPTTELQFSLKFADAFIGFANATVIDDTATVAGVTTVTGGFGDATVPANKCLYFLFDADPDDAIKSATVKMSYTLD